MLRASFASRGGAALLSELLSDIAPYYAGLRRRDGRPLRLPIEAGVKLLLAKIGVQECDEGTCEYRLSDMHPPSAEQVSAVRLAANAAVVQPGARLRGSCFGVLLARSGPSHLVSKGRRSE